MTEKIETWLSNSFAHCGTSGAKLCRWAPVSSLNFLRLNFPFDMQTGMLVLTQINRHLKIRLQVRDTSSWGYCWDPEQRISRINRLRQGGGDRRGNFRDEENKRAPRDALRGRERVKERQR